MAFGAFGDRFDHELASANALFKYKNHFGRLILMGEWRAPHLAALRCDQQARSQVSLRCY